MKSAPKKMRMEIARLNFFQSATRIYTFLREGYSKLSEFSLMKHCINIPETYEKHMFLTTRYIHITPTIYT